MKTILDWYQELPEPYRTQAIENCDEDSLNIFENNIKSAISGGFLWFDTEQGADYWLVLYDRYE